MAHLVATGLQTANGTAPIERRDVSGLWSNPSCKAAPFPMHPRRRSCRPKPPPGGVCVKRTRIVWRGLPRCDVRRSLGRARWWRSCQPARPTFSLRARTEGQGKGVSSPPTFRQRGCRFSSHSAIPGFTFPSRSSQPRASAQPMQMQVPAPPTVTGAR